MLIGYYFSKHPVHSYLLFTMHLLFHAAINVVSMNISLFGTMFCW